jgi:acyl dehydratase
MFVIDAKTYSSFLDISKDYNPLHTDNKFAAEKGFKSKVMHGNILNCFLSYFIGEMLPQKNVIIHSQEVQYKHAVYLNDRLEFQAIVDAIYKSVNVIIFKYTFKNESSKVVGKGKIQIGLLK